MSMSEYALNMAKPHKLPIGAVVVFTDKEADQRARLVVVQHSRDCDGTPLYMAGEKAIAPPPDEYKLFSKGYMAYRMLVGWFVGNVERGSFRDTGERVDVKPFDVERYARPGE